MRLRTVSSIILPSAHKVKASARNSVTTVVGGGRETLRGTLERVPRTPQNFSQILYWRGWGGGAERGLAPGGGRAPARHLFALPPCCLVGGARRFWSPACPAFSFLSCPHPPDPRSQSALPGGKGETKGYFMQGAKPLASPGLNPGGTGFSCGKRYPRGFASCGAG